MRELIKDNQLVTIVPQDFKKTNKGRVLEVSPEGEHGLVHGQGCDL